MRRTIQLAFALGLLAGACHAQQRLAPVQTNFAACVTVTLQADPAADADNPLIDIVVKNGCDRTLDITVGLKFMANGIRIIEDGNMGTQFIAVQPGEVAQSIAVLGVAGSTPCVRNVKAVEAQ